MRNTLLALMLVLPGIAFAQGWPAVNSIITPGRTAIVVQPYTATNATLKTLKGTDYPSGVHRLGFYFGNDGGGAFYYWAVAPCAAPDDGAQVTASDGGCWIADFSVAPPNVRQWGAKGDCVADDGPAFIAAMNTGRPIHVPNGHFLIGTAGVFTSKPVKLIGEGYSEDGLYYTRLCDLTQPGSYLVQKDSAISLFSLTGFPIRGSWFEKIAILQSHLDPATANWAPTVYPPVWALHSTGGEVDFRDIGLGGVYAAIDATGNTARINMRGIRGQIFSFLFRVDIAYDVSKLSDVHIWPFWDNRQSTLDWQIGNTDVIVLGRQDSFQVGDFFALGQRSCFRLSAGPPTAVNIDSLNCDVTKYSIWQDSTSSYGYISVSHLWHGGGSLTAGQAISGGNVIELDGQGAAVKVDEMNIVITEGSVVNQTNSGNGAQVTLGSVTGFGGGWNWSGTTPYSGTSSTIRDVSNAATPSVYSFSQPIWPQNAGYSCCNGEVSGIIDPNSNALLYMASGMDQAWYMPTYVNSGGTINWPPWASRLVLRTAASSLSIVLPAAILDGTELTLWCDLTITSLSVTSTNLAVANPPTSCSAGQSFRFVLNYGANGAIRTLH